MIYQIDSGYFCAGVEVENGRCIYAAPIVRWMMGKTETFLHQYCQKRGWILKGVSNATKEG
jgi:hypothetical protein